VAPRQRRCRDSSRGQQAAVDGQRDAGDIAAGVAGKEDQRRAEFRGVAEPAFQVAASKARRQPDISLIAG
jgi:hypothetical protein